MDEARAAMGSVMDGEATPAQLAALLVALRMRGEAVEELAGFAAAMRERVLRVDAPDGRDRCRRDRRRRQRDVQHLDDVGPGGRGGRRPRREARQPGHHLASGSADVLDALGVRIDHDALSAGAALRDTGFAFLFAPGFHPAMKYAGPTRREIGVRTAFNLIGPLTNPAGTTRQLIGVAEGGGCAADRGGRSGSSARSGRSSSTATGSTSCRSTDPASSST